MRAQARLQLIERAEVKRLELVERVGRIESAIAVSRTDEGLSPRTNELMTRTALLADRLDLELGIAGERLLAATRRSTQEQIAAIETRLLHADMALARLQDERLLAVEAAP